MSTKADLRKIYVGKRNSLSAKDRVVKNRQIAGRFFEQFDLDNIHILHIYLSIDKAGEIDTSLIIDGVWSGFPPIRTVVPRINRQTDRLESVEYNPKSNLITNRWGIREPGEDKMVRDEGIDLVVVPLLCFDTNGHRVGYGKGYYDKFLAGCRPHCLKIGISYFYAVEGISDIHAGDVKLDLVITPDKVWKF